MCVTYCLKRTGLEATAKKQQQQQPELLTQHKSQTPIPAEAQTAATTTASSSSTSARSSGGNWFMQRIKQILVHVERAILATVSAIADRLNWWSLLLRGLRSPLLSGPLVSVLKAYNAAASEHSKRLLSNEFNAKFRYVWVLLPAATAALLGLLLQLEILPSQYQTVAHCLSTVHCWTVYYCGDYRHLAGLLPSQQHKQWGSC